MKNARIMSAVLVLLALAGITGYRSFTPGNQQLTNLVSDVPGVAETFDSRLVNPWGMAQSVNGPWWVADTGMGISTLYTGEGVAYPALAPLTVTIPPPAGVAYGSTPTGIVFNGSDDFIVDIGKPARFIFATEEGTLSGWNPEVDSHYAVLVADNSSSAVYKGLALGQLNGNNYLYAANFRAGSVDVFDAYFHQVWFGNSAFVDALVPDGFAPFNVQNIEGELYVSYAMQDGEGSDAVIGSGFGYITVFDTSGNLRIRLQSGVWMNAPWGMALAPDDFGKYGGDLLAANSGNGTIAAFDYNTGKFKGLLQNADGNPITIEGLRGIGFGNNNLAGPSAVLYFSAGIENGKHGLFGSLKPVPP